MATTPQRSSKSDPAARIGVFGGRHFVAAFWVRMGILTIIITSYVATIIVTVENERQLIDTEIQRLAGVTATSAQRHVETIFEATMQTLGALQADLSEQSASRSPQQIIDDHFFSPPYLRATFLIDRRGEILSSSFRESIGNDASIFPFFQIHQETKGETGIYTGDIIVGELTRAPHFFSSASVSDSEGQFNGIVAAAYELTYLRDLFRQLVPGENYAIGLFHVQDGLIVASDSEILAGELPTSSQFPTNVSMEAETTAGTFNVLLENGGEALTENRRVGTSLYFISTMADVELLHADLIQDSLLKYILAAVFVCTVIGLAIALEVYLLKQRAAEASKAALENQLRQSQKMDALGTLAGGLAHDFNNLLSSIIGFGEVARERSEGNKNTQQAVDQILLAGRRAESVVNHILTFSRATDPSFTPVPMDNVVHEVLELMKASLPSSIKMEVNIGEGTPCVEGDAVQLTQVMLNLCTNATHAMPTGGTMRIDVAQVQIGNEEQGVTRTLEPGSYVRASVWDTGPGIDPKVEDRIFEPFFTTKKRGKGTGLGLSIVHGIVATHNGAIELETRPTIEGTCFHLYFPASSEQAHEIVRVETPKIEGRGRLVMIVDDEEPIVDLLEERLAATGFEPAGFCDSAHALAAFREAPEKFNLLVTDFSMPGLDGLQLAKSIREARADLPIILMTGFGVSDVAQRASELGIREIVKKPVRVRQLLESVARALHVPAD